MNTPWGDVIDGVVQIADDLITTDEERGKLALQGREIDARLVLGQQKVNEVSAAHPSRFVAGGRPAVIWIGAAALGYQFLLYPLMVWAWTLAQATGLIPLDVKPPPLLDIEALMVLVTALLGAAGMRSFDKRGQVDTKRIE